MTTQSMASFDTATQAAGLSVRASSPPRAKTVKISDVDSLLSNIRKRLAGSERGAEEEDQATATQAAPQEVRVRPFSQWIKDFAHSVVDRKVRKHSDSLGGSLAGGASQGNERSVETLLSELDASAERLSRTSVPPPGRTHATDAMRTLHGIQMAKVDLSGQMDRNLAAELSRFLPTAQRALRAIHDSAAKQLKEVDAVQSKYSERARAATREFSTTVDSTLSKLDADWSAFLRAYFGKDGGQSMRFLVANANHEAPLSDRVHRFLAMEKDGDESERAQRGAPAAEAAAASARSDLRVIPTSRWRGSCPSYRISRLDAPNLLEEGRATSMLCARWTPSIGCCTTRRSLSRAAAFAPNAPSRRRWTRAPRR